jgi:hypothetical protein
MSNANDRDPGETADWLRAEAAIAQASADQHRAHEAAIAARMP